MNRSISVDRLYTLGDYKNIRFVNTINDIPEELASNPRIIELLYAQEYLQCEAGYRKYVNMLEKMNEETTTMVAGKRVADPQAVAEFLAEERERNMRELYEEIKKVGEEKELNNEKETV